LADGSVVAGMDEMESISSSESVADVLVAVPAAEPVEVVAAEEPVVEVLETAELETAAGEEGAEGSSAYIPTDIVAESSLQDFGRGPNPGVSNLPGVAVDEIMTDDSNDFSPTAENASNASEEDNPIPVTGQLSGSDLDRDLIEYVLVD